MVISQSVTLFFFVIFFERLLYEDERYCGHLKHEQQTKRKKQRQAQGTSTQ